MFPSRSFQSTGDRFQRLPSGYDNFIQNISKLDPETTAPANDILIQMRNLQDELLSSQRLVDDLRVELKGARDALSHYEDIVVPKFEHHTELSRQNEAKLKALLTKLSAERDTLSSEVNRLTARMDIHLRDSASAKSYQHVAEERVALLEATLEAMRSEYDAKLRAQTATTVADAVAESVDRVRSEFEKKLMLVVEERRQETQERDDIIRDLQQKLDFLEGEREKLLTVVSALRTEVSTREEAQCRADQELEQLRLVVEHLGKERDVLTTRLSAYTEDLTELQGRLNATTAYNSELATVNNEMRAGSQSLRADLESFEERQQRTKRYILHLTHVISVLESFIAKKIAQMKESKAAAQARAQANGAKASGKAPLGKKMTENSGTGTSHIRNRSAVRKSRPSSSQNHDHPENTTRPGKVQIPNLSLSQSGLQTSSSSLLGPDDNDMFLARIDARLHGIYETTTPSSSCTPTFSPSYHTPTSPYSSAVTRDMAHTPTGPNNVSRVSTSIPTTQNANVHLSSMNMDMPMPAVNAQNIADGYYDTMALPRSPGYKGVHMGHSPAECCHQGTCSNTLIRPTPTTPTPGPDAHLKPWVPVSAHPDPLGPPPMTAVPSVGDWEKAPSFATIGIEDEKGDTNDASNTIVPSIYRHKLTVLSNELAKMRASYAQALADNVGSRGGSHSVVAWESRNDPAFVQDVLADDKLRGMLEHGIDKKQREIFELKEAINEYHAEARQKEEAKRRQEKEKEAERARQEELMLRKHSLRPKKQTRQDKVGSRNTTNK